MYVVMGMESNLVGWGGDGSNYLGMGWKWE